MCLDHLFNISFFLSLHIYYYLLTPNLTTRFLVGCILLFQFSSMRYAYKLYVYIYSIYIFSRYIYLHIIIIIMTTINIYILVIKRIHIEFGTSLPHSMTPVEEKKIIYTRTTIINLNWYSVICAVYMCSYVWTHAPVLQVFFHMCVWRQRRQISTI